MYKLSRGESEVEGGKYTVYGIYYNEEYYIEDISTDKEAVMELIALLNSNDLAPYQLYDVVEDLLNK